MPEMSNGLDLDRTGSGICRIVLIFDWIRLVKCLTILDQDRIWTELMDKNCVIVVFKKLHFAKFFDCLWTWFLHFLNLRTMVGLGLSF